MPRAFVLINCDLGHEDNLIKSIKEIHIVKEVQGTYGAYDILAKIESNSSEELREVITSKIRKIGGIKSTITLMGVEGQSFVA